MRKLLSAMIAAVMTVGLFTPVRAADGTALDAAAEKTAAYVYNAVKDPQVDSVGGEWAVLGLARGGYDVPDAYYENYYRTVENYVRERGGALHDVKYTEYSRVIIGLTAAGFDPRDVAGHDLTAPLEDFDKTVWQGVNGPIFALIALDSLNYPNGQRDAYVAEILRRQLNDGGWNLTGSGAGDPDVTGMALQALAKYRSEPEVKTATDKAVSFLSKAQDADGGYSSWGETNVESAVQVLVALCELGVPVDDARFVKNGRTLIDEVLSFANADGGFDHARGGGGVTLMSAEQALYGLVAAQRAAGGKNSLYSMGDAVRRGGSARPPSEPGLPGKHEDVKVMPVTDAGRTFTDILNHPNRPAIEALAERGIINGVGGGLFAPDATMTRAEFAAIVTRGLGLPDKTRSPFDDAAAGSWYAVPVATAYFYEIVAGTSATTFTPGATITRQEAAVMVARAARLCGMDTARADAEIRDTLAQFGDYRTSAAWARADLAFCYDTGVLDDGATDIKPEEAVKRCEIAEMTHGLLDKANLL
jgi:hypothetical protein